MHTSILPTLLQMIHALSVVALPHFFTNEPCHHDLDPLLTDDCVSGVGDGLAVSHVDAIEGGWDGGLLP